jgi:uncharacterized protein (DUF488 family)
MLNRIYTIGHSTWELIELVRLLAEHGVTRLADIRRFPGSRRHPYFSKESLEHQLPRAGIAYEHFEALGGRRRPHKKSRNMAWESEQFRGYADHMGTEEFKAAVERLLNGERNTAVMCAEAVPWNCHRNLLSDDLVRRGIEVVHITGPGQSRRHQLNEMATIDGDCVIYPPRQPGLF